MHYARSTGSNLMDELKRYHLMTPLNVSIGYHLVLIAPQMSEAEVWMGISGYGPLGHLENKPLAMILWDNIVTKNNNI